MPVKSCKSCMSTPSFHMADRVALIRLYREQAALAIGVGCDLAPHGIEHVDDFDGITREGMYGRRLRFQQTDFI